MSVLCGGQGDWQLSLGAGSWQLSAQREGYSYKIDNFNLDDSKEKNIDFATDIENIYWPFNGEFWDDELGYYEYAEAGCE